MRSLLLAALLAAIPVHAQTLRFAIAADAATLDPHAVNLLTTTRLTASVYESLVGRDKDFNIVPWLADALAIVTRELPIVPLTQNIIPWAMRTNVRAIGAPNGVAYFFRFRMS